MKKFINHIRSKPERTKRNILHVLTAFFAVVLLLLWIYSLGTSLSNPDTQKRVSNDLKPFATLKDSMVDGYKSISESQ